MKSIKTAVLVNRPDKEHAVVPDWVGMECGGFILGYGLDYNQKARHYRDLYVKVDE